MNARLFAFVALACGVVLSAGALRAEADHLTEWLGLGPVMGPYLVLLSASLLSTHPTRLSLAVRWVSLAAAAVTAAAPVAASWLVNGAAAPAVGAAPPWPAVGLLTLAAAALAGHLAPARAAQWVVPVLLVAPYVAAFGCALLVFGLWTWVTDWAAGGMTESTIAATGLAAASTAVLLRPLSRPAAAARLQPDSVDGQTSVRMTRLVAVVLPVIVGLCTLVAGIVAARYWAAVDIERAKAHLTAHAEGLAYELDRQGIRNPALGEPAPRPGAVQPDAFVFWRAGHWWLSRLPLTSDAATEDAAPLRAYVIETLFASAGPGKARVALCETAERRRCWVQGTGSPELVDSLPGSSTAAQPHGRLAISADVPATRLTVTKSRTAEGLFAGAAEALHALVVPALFLAGAGSILTMCCAGPLIRRLDGLQRDLGSLVKGLPVAVVALDASDRIVLTNAAARALLGRGEARAVNTPLDRILQALALSAADPADACRPRSVPVEFTTPAGSVVHVEASAHPLPGDDSGARVLVMHDVTRRKHAEDELVRALAWRDGILETAGEGICVIDANGGLMLANPAARVLLALPTGGHTQESERVRAFRDAVCSVSAAAAPHRGTIALQDVDGDELTIEFVETPVADSSGTRVIVLRDVSAERRHAREIELARAMLRRTEELGLIGGWHLDLTTGRQVWSEGKYRIHGLPNGTPPSSELHMQCVHPDDRLRLEAVVRHALATYEPHEVRYRIFVNGEVRWICGRGSFTFDAMNRPTAWSGTIQDITTLLERERELLASRQRVRDLASRREREREEERAHLAREVHDELGQQLTALRLCAHRMQRFVDGDAEARAKAVADLKVQIDETGAIVRSLLGHMRAAVLEFGLAVAVERLCSEFEARNDAAIVLESRLTDSDLSQDQAAAVFRTMQEALTNVARHADAENVTVRLWLDEPGDEVVLTVEDDGRGFDPQVVRQRRTFGLMGMRERALALGGSVRVSGGLGTGTAVTLRIPRRPVDRSLDEQEEVVA